MAQPPSSADASFDVQPVIDRQTRVAPHLPLLIVMTLIMLIDGYDVFMLGKIAPAMAADFGEPVTRFTLIFVLQQAGLAIGSFVVGPVSDRFGRKLVMLICVLMFGMLTLLPIWAETLYQVAILRGIAGLFLAGVIPNVATMLTEIAPPRRRAAFVSISFTGYTAGGAGGALMAIWLLDAYGWTSAFLIGGIMPLILAPLLMLTTDESLQFRIRRNPRDPRIARALLKLDPTLDLRGVESFRLGDGTAAGRSPKPGDALGVFRDGRTRMTLMLWLAFFLALGVVSLLGSWMATFFFQLASVPLSRWAAYSLIGFAGGLVGTSTIGFLMDRFGRGRVLVTVFVIDAAALAAIGMLPFASVPFVIAMIVWGYCQAGGQAGINAICAQTYPTSIRASGVGWAFGMGRLGGIALPALGGLMLASEATRSQIFLAIAVAPLLVAAALLGVQHAASRRPHQRG
jgi:AAHS family 4-hydroxybenzoate transporter-like MFS transporter